MNGSPSTSGNAAVITIDAQIGAARSCADREPRHFHSETPGICLVEIPETATGAVDADFPGPAFITLAVGSSGICTITASLPMLGLTTSHDYLVTK